MSTYLLILFQFGCLIFLVIIDESSCQGTCWSKDRVNDKDGHLNSFNKSPRNNDGNIHTHRVTTSITGNYTSDIGGLKYTGK